METDTSVEGAVAGMDTLAIQHAPEHPSKSGRRNVLVTSALPYVNNVPHLGNIIGCVLSGDVYARFCRLQGHNTLYVCGTDEYGTATETKAIEEGVTPREICDKYHAIHREIYEWFDIAFDVFGRTSTAKQTEVAQDIFLRLHERGLLEEKDVEQLYCEDLGMFLADRFVIGTCPHCEYEDARGDQCDNCGKLLNPTELIKPRAKMAPEAKVEVRSTRHVFLNLPALAERLDEFVEKASSDGGWSANSVQLTRAWLRDGLKPRCVTRDLKWGTPVPLEKFKDKVFYVWFDAPIGYISITAGARDDWESWWKNPENVELVQFMGKDNVPFHTVIFPSSLMGADDNYTLLRKISTTEYLNYEDKQFSKSRGVGVFGNDAKSTGIPSEVWRYYLLANRPESSDSYFSWDDLMSKNNNELLANIGNLANRTLTFIKNNFDGCIPSIELTESDNKFIAEVQGDITSYTAAMEQCKIREGLRLAMSVSRRGNQYFQDNEPWKAIKTDKARAGSVMALCANLLRSMQALFEPFIPGFSAKLGKQLNTSVKFGEGFSFSAEMLPNGHEIGSPSPLFRKLGADEMKKFKRRFGGEGREAFPLDLRVGVIAKVENHSDSDRLYVVQVNIGTETRQIVAGLRDVYTADELVGKHVVVVCNLREADLRGVASQGMMLAATKNKVTGLLVAPASAPGTLVTADECDRKPEEDIDINRFRKIQLRTGPDGTVQYKKEYVLRSEKEPLQAERAAPGAVVK